jgi:hypothetical protein
MRFAAVHDRLQSLRNEAVKNVVYSMNAIRTDFKDPDTDNLACAADLNASIPDWGSAHLKISYSVQKTSDHKIYVQVFGLVE